MRTAYNYTMVETHKQKLYIPYVGIELEGWAMVFLMLLGVVLGVFILGLPLSLIMGEFGFVFSIAVTAILEFIAVTYATEIDREYGKNKMMTFYYINIKKYRCIYDAHGERHYIAGKKEGVLYTDVC